VRTLWTFQGGVEERSSVRRMNEISAQVCLGMVAMAWADLVSAVVLAYRSFLRLLAG